MANAAPLTVDEVAALVRMIEDLRAENARLRSTQSLLGVLREISVDPNVPVHLRLKAAEVGVSHETPKLTQSVQALFTSSDDSIAARLKRGLERAERARQAEALGWKTIEGGRDDGPEAA
jgi:hypothetical protein